MPEFTGAPQGAGHRMAIVASRFNERVTQALADGALDGLLRHGVSLDDVDVIWVPGAWELPGAVRRAASSDRYSGIVAIGAIVRGETPHFDFIAAEAARGLAQVASDYDVPVGLGLLTCNDMAQAESRSGGDHGNKGWDAAIATLEMVDLFQRLDLMQAAEADADEDEG